MDSNCLAVTPAKAGVQVFPGAVDSRLRGNDAFGSWDAALRAYPAVAPAGLALVGRYGFFSEAPGDPAFDARQAFLDARQVGSDARSMRAFKPPYKRHCRTASATPTPMMAQNSGFTVCLPVLQRDHTLVLNIDFVPRRVKSFRVAFLCGWHEVWQSQ